MTQKALPAWALPAAIAAGILVLGLIAWRAMTGTSVPTGTDIEVKPGQYDLRAEMQKPRTQKRRPGAPAVGTPP